MPTRAGWLVVAGAIGTFIAAWLFGLVELYLVATGLSALVAVSVARVALTRLQLDVGRQVTPPRVHAGQPARVELAVTNRGDGATPVLRLHDPVTGTQGATILLAPVLDGTMVRSAYRLPTEQRGVIQVGPLGVEVTDPFGLASVRATAAPVVELIVLPRVDHVLPPPVAGSDEPLAGRRHVSLATSGGADFAALREYVVGDDLRRVHWASSARHDELIVRQDEIRWQGRSTVVLDTRVHTHRGQSFEVAVSAAASVVSAAFTRGDLVRLLTTSGFDSGVSAAHGHVERILEVLATVSAAQAGSLRQVVDSAVKQGGSLVLVVGALAEQELRTTMEAIGPLASALVVATAGPAPAGGHRDLVLATDQPFATAWNAAVAGRRGGRRGPRVVAS